VDAREKAFTILVVASIAQAIDNELIARGQL
jgi:hypothetical protein